MLKAGLAHLWFVTIHPFDDGNGRIARAIADHGARALRTQPAAVLQHVGTDPAGAESVLRHSGADSERNHGHHALDGLVSRVSRPCHRWRANGAKRGSRERRASGNAFRVLRSTTVSDSSSIDCWRASKESSLPQNTQSLRGARRTRRSGIFFRSSSKAFLFATRKAAEAPAIRWRATQAAAKPER